jgi:serine/threonine-protein kinase
MPGLHNVFETPTGLALVLDWLPGEVLNDYQRFPGRAGRENPASPHARFRALPVEQIVDALSAIYDAHCALAAQGFIAVDFYDGSIMYDFDRSRAYLCDIDEYQPGPFVLQADRLLGSRRFMAPEEFQRGARIDQVTNVYTLGRTAIVFLGDGHPDVASWRGNCATWEVVRKATSLDRDQRYASVRAYVGDWRAAIR